MAVNSAISWTDHTYNPWRGCTKVGPGCDFCYAAERDVRYEGGLHWGAGAPRIRAAMPTRHAPFKIARLVESGRLTGRKVFAASLADIFDNEVPPEWRADFWDVVRQTPQLDYLLVTKRIGNVHRMLPQNFPAAYQHVGIIATMVDQNEIDRDLPKLIAVKQWFGVSWIGLSIEPQLGPVKLPYDACGLDWAITGGESRQPSHGTTGFKPRAYNLDWARMLIEQSSRNGVAIFVKQVGANPIGCDRPADGMGKEPAEWPEDIRVQQFPPQLLARA